MHVRGVSVFALNFKLHTQKGISAAQPDCSKPSHLEERKQFMICLNYEGIWKNSNVCVCVSVYLCDENNNDVMNSSFLGNSMTKAYCVFIVGCRRI